MWAGVDGASTKPRIGATLLLAWVAVTTRDQLRGYSNCPASCIVPFQIDADSKASMEMCKQ